MRLRALCIIAVAACRGGPAYQLSIPTSYEVGEDATIAIEAHETRKEPADLIITRPDGSRLQKRAKLRAKQTRVKFGTPLVERTSQPTFTQTGQYKIELRSGTHTLATQQITVSTDRLTQIFTNDPIAGFGPTVRYARPRQDGTLRWMTYGAIYERLEGRETEIHVLIEEAGPNAARAFKQYEDAGTLGVFENSNVRLYERTDNVSTSWRSRERIVVIRARTPRDLDRPFIRAFLAKYPSDLKAH